jgi:membrane associated rhomboid family serine protease
MDRLILILLGIWALLTGIFTVTNLQVAWSGPLLGFAALALGIVCLIRAFR